MGILRKLVSLKSVSAIVPVVAVAGIGLSSVSVYASTIALQDFSNPETEFDRPDHAPPDRPPIDTPAFYHGLVIAPVTMPASVPFHILPGTGFGQAIVPVPAAIWLFGSGLLGLIKIARRKNAT